MDEAVVFERIANFLIEQFTIRGSNIAIVGISGGIDSAVTTAMAAQSLGPEKVYGLIIPDYSVTPRTDVKDALELSKSLKIQHKVIDITDRKKIMLEGFPNNKLARGNFLVRLRMAILYYYAAVKNGLVIGTADKSEFQLGYFTKHGDGGADIFPIADMYKTEVKEFAKYLNISPRIINKKSSARIWQGQTAEGEIGVTYDKIDLILKNIKDIDITNSQFPQIDNVNNKEIKIVFEWIKNNRHKHELPIPFCRLS